MSKEKKDIPMISRLMRSVLLEDYAEAISIITDENFNPNEKTKEWGAPVLTALLTVLSSVDKIDDNESVKLIFKSIAKHKDFDPNLKDSEGSTILMHIAEHSKFNWLAPDILEREPDINMRNFMNNTVIEIANKSKNTVLANILLAYKNSHHRGLPVKRVRKRDNTENIALVRRLLTSFGSDAIADDTSLYHLIRNFLVGNYAEAISIAKKITFNPNEVDRWEEPGLSCLLYFAMDQSCKYDNDKFKELCMAIINHPLFDPNTIDSDGNSVLMVSFMFPQLKWLTEKLFMMPGARIDYVNDEGQSARDIAEMNGTSNFYNDLLGKAFDEADKVFTLVK